MMVADMRVAESEAFSAWRCRARRTAPALRAQTEKLRAKPGRLASDADRGESLSIFPPESFGKSAWSRCLKFSKFDLPVKTHHSQSFHESFELLLSPTCRRQHKIKRVILWAIMRERRQSEPLKLPVFRRVFCEFLMGFARRVLLDCETYPLPRTWNKARPGVAASHDRKDLIHENLDGN